MSKLLTNYVIGKGIVGEEDREVYEYGFTVAMEVGLFAILCVGIMLITRMYLEGILFFVVFTPLRSYAGGLHLKKYYACLILSVLTFSVILLITRSISLPVIWADIISIVSLIGVYLLYPVENANREVDPEEDRYFRRKLIRFLIIDVILILFFSYFCFYKSITVIALTIFMVCVTMILGKCAGHLHSPSR